MNTEFSTLECTPQTEAAMAPASDFVCNLLVVPADLAERLERELSFARYQLLSYSQAMSKILDQVEEATTAALKSKRAELACTHPTTCRHCGGNMRLGVAIPSAQVPTDPTHEGTASTITQGAWQNTAPLSPVLKCISCGHSITPTK